MCLGLAFCVCFCFNLDYFVIVLFVFVAFGCFFSTIPGDWLGRTCPE